MKRRVFLLLLATSIVTGCGTTYRYYNPNKTTQQHYQDEYECKQQATYSQAGAVSNQYGMVYGNDQATNTDLLFLCLRSRGYTVTIE